MRLPTAHSLRMITAYGALLCLLIAIAVLVIRQRRAAQIAASGFGRDHGGSRASAPLVPYLMDTSGSQSDMESVNFSSVEMTDESDIEQNSLAAQVSAVLDRLNQSEAPRAPDATLSSAAAAAVAAAAAAAAVEHTRGESGRTVLITEQLSWLLVCSISVADWIFILCWTSRPGLTLKSRVVHGAVIVYALAVEQPATPLWVDVCLNSKWSINRTWSINR